MIPNREGAPVPGRQCREGSQAFVSGHAANPRPAGPPGGNRDRHRQPTPTLQTRRYWTSSSSPLPVVPFWSKRKIQVAISARMSSRTRTTHGGPLLPGENGIRFRPL